MIREIEQRFHGSLYLGLQRLRGRPVGPFVERLRAWERQDHDAFREMTRRRLDHALAYARRTVPLYSSDPWRTALARAAPDDLGAWPVLERKVARERIAELQAQPRPRLVFDRRSSASSGEAVRVPFDSEAGAWNWANEYRAMLWHGVAPGVRTLMLWRRREPLLDWIRNARVFATRDLTPTQLERAAQYLLTRKPQLLVGLPSAAAQFARHLHAHHAGARRPLVPFIKVGGEQLYPFEREQIETHLGGRVVESYGCTEVGAIAMECPAGSMHLFTEHVHVEIFRDDTPLPPGEFGDLVVTSLWNRATPLVRYRLGDSGRISPEPCACGLPHPVLTNLVGRAADVFAGCDGKIVHGSQIGSGLRSFLANAPRGAVRQVLFQQIDPRRWKVLVEAGMGFDETLGAGLRDIVKRTLGRECRVDIERVAVVPREPSGKFRYYRPAPAASGAASDGRGSAGRGDRAVASGSA